MAIEKIIKGNYDRIICDLMLKDITGFDVIEESKRKYSAIDISNIFVIITAYSSEQVITKAAEYGCAVLSKPFSDINAALRLFLNKQDQL